MATSKGGRQGRKQRRRQARWDKKIGERLLGIRRKFPSLTTDEFQQFQLDRELGENPIHPDNDPFLKKAN